ncbi:NAC domain [Macleaya cordata]|uniref:NAC domain n=1 Tax=Macleaya cordata TaxID=56857 RepID=A0A200QFU6_MACCD|nr:NAC domain [Macleaya cordata]
MKITDSSCGGGGGAVAVSCMDDDLFGDPKSWPPGFRFHPTDEELVLYYLKRKICRRRLKLRVIADIDVYKWDPEELPGQSVLKSGDRQWYFFSPRDRKYPNGARSNRATRHGYWKATGKDRHIEWNSRPVGSKKTLVFYRGRAPNGERTDWVMHEYTLDEEELKRCKSAQDCYALYKVYKKSGPGPKNGEQYGAPFREEEWADDSDLVEENAPNNNLAQHLVDNNVNGDKSLVDNQCQPQLDILDELLGLIGDGSEIDKRQENGLEYALPKVGFEKDFENTTMGPSLGQAISTEPSVVSNPSCIQRDAQYSFDVTQSAISYLPSHEAPEVTSTQDISQQALYEVEEDNFLEMDDLNGPQPSFSDMQHGGDNLIFEEPDLYFDAAMFLRDMGPIGQGTSPNPYFDNLGGEISSHLDYQMQQSQLYDVADPITTQLWVHDQKSNVFMSSESNQVVMAPSTSGTIHFGGSSSNFHGEERHNQGGEEGDDVDKWFSSAISSFLGSIPTRPALASENAIINRAFERMSSFGRVRIGARDADVNRGVNPAVGRRNTGRKGGFFFLSILVAVCAVSWLLMIGTTVKVLKTFVGKFIAS